MSDIEVVEINIPPPVTFTITIPAFPGINELPVPEFTVEEIAAIQAATSGLVVQMEAHETGVQHWYGGMIGSDWKINRFVMTPTITKASAVYAWNPTFPSLTSAWSVRAQLTYL